MKNTLGVDLIRGISKKSGFIGVSPIIKSTIHVNKNHQPKLFQAIVNGLVFAVYKESERPFAKKYIFDISTVLGICSKK